MKQPAYLRLYLRLREEIIGGDLPYGSRLPSRRTAAEAAGLSETTVLHAYELLCDEGYVAPRQRSGYFVCYRDQELAALPVPGELPPRAVQSTGQETLPWPTYARAMRRVMSQWGSRLLERSENQGCLELRSVLTAYLGAERGIHAGPEQLVIGAGAEYLYSMIAQLMGQGCRAAVEDPCYEAIRQVYQANGLCCVPLPLDEEGVRLDALENSGCALLHVTPFRSYPSGVTASATRRHAYVRWAWKHGGYIVEDNYDSEFSPSSKAEDAVFTLAPQGRVLYLSTFSRTVAPSIRVGYLVLPPALAERYRACLGFYACPVPVTEQLLLSELIRSGEYTRHVNRIRRRRRNQKTPRTVP